jgi:hypothetical protein
MFKKITTYSLVALLFGTGSVALAHTGVRDQGVEGKTLYTAFTIGHGCGSTANPVQLPVIAQSIVFPNAADSVAVKLGLASDGTTVTETPIDITTEITGLTAGAGLSTLSPKGVNDGLMFKKASSIVNELNVIRGLKFSGGKLDPTMVGVVPFRVSGVKFEPTSCAQSLKVRVAIANWCKTNATNKAQAGDEDRRADFWLGTPTAKFSNPNVISSGYWPTLTVARDLVANPLPASCNGVGYDVAIQPSSADIDKYLPMAGFPLGK